MLPLLLPYCCQEPTGAPGPFLWRVCCSSTGIRRADERTRTAFLLITNGDSCCWDLQGVANTAYLSRFLYPGLPCVAPYCARGGVRVVSTLDRCNPLLPTTKHQKELGT